MGVIVADEVHLTLGYRVAAAWDIINNYDAWGAIGRTTAWADEDNPPAEDQTATSMDELQGFKKIMEFYKGCVWPVPTDATADFEYMGLYWRKASSLDEALTNGARWALFKLVLEPTELPIVTFRQMGLFLNVEPATGYEGYSVLLPSQTDSTGSFYFYANHLPWKRYANQADQIIFVIEY